jgi:hypothetical protein
MLLARSFTMPLFPGRDSKGGEGMAFQELRAMQVAYELLSPLDPSAQQRVMAWLSAALGDANGVAPAIDEPTEISSPDSIADVAAQHVAAAAPAVERVAAVEPQTAVEPQAAVEPEPGPGTEPAPTQRPKRGRSTQPTGRRAAKAAKASATATPVEEPAGRRGERPSGGQFVADLTAVGSFKALAEKYGKSIGTIGNWANQLREQGFDIPTGRQKRS